MWDPYAEFETTVMLNDLTVYSSCWSGRPWEVMGFVVHSGANQDPVGLEGLAHFTEHIISKNVPFRPSDLTSFLEVRGGSAHLGKTSHSLTYYRFFAPVEKEILAKMLWMFGEMLTSVKIERELEKVRQDIVNEFRENFPFDFLHELALREHRALYQGYWLERSARPLGTLHSISRITYEDLRGFYGKHFSTANISVVAVGGLKTEELINLIAESPLATFKKGERNPLPKPVSDIAPPKENLVICKLSDYMSVPAMAGSYRSVAVIPGVVNEQAVRFISNMLTEILFETVREKLGQTYHIESSWCNYLRFYELAIECDKVSLNGVEKIEEIVSQVIASLGDNRKLFKKVKRRALARLNMVDYSVNDLCDSVVNDLSDYHRIITLKEYGEALKAIEFDEVLSTLEWLAPERRYTQITL